MCESIWWPFAVYGALAGGVAVGVICVAILMMAKDE